jgi:cyclopropane-fatty-acyl-phospholipid synthase
VSTVLSLVEKKLATLPLPVQVQLPSGEVAGPQSPRMKLIVRDNATLLNLARGQTGKLGEDFVEGRFDFEGSMRDMMLLASSILEGSPVDAAKGNAFTRMLRHAISVARHSKERDARQIQFHYDLSDEFYALWLDPRRVYSCAYFAQPDFSLAQAQMAKLDHICSKLRLREGERFIDIGAGWGGLLLWAAENYGVDATGITLSRNQHAHVNRLIEEKGLSGRVRMVLLDYRDVDEAQPFDKIASVGMFEHVGRAQLQEYFAKLKRLLRPGGLILNHGITAGGVFNAEVGAGMGQFIEKYIFPGGELTHIGNELMQLASAGLEDLDVENLRPHYARTLWAWSDALEAQLDAARATLKGENAERSVRAYRMYLAGCAMGFENGWIAIHQVLMQHKPSAGRSDELDNPADLAYPWRRGYMYQK